MRLIDADALIGDLHNHAFLEGDDRKIVYSVIQKQPTIEQPKQKFFVGFDGKITPLPIQKHGNWIPIKSPTGVEYGGFKEYTVQEVMCSDCGFTEDVSASIYTYCPECGAKMSKEVKQDEEVRQE